MTPLHLAFVAVAMYSTCVQVRSYALREVLDAAPDSPDAFRVEYESIVRKRGIVTPFIGGLTALLVAVGVSIALAGVAYSTLEVSPEKFGIVLAYSVSVATLLCGGILSAINGHPHLAYIGIAYFFSDWLVGMRNFGKRPPAWLQKNALILILILYYTIMLTSIDYAFSA